MITIVEPKEHIARLWGEQRIKENETYRMMRYVLRVEHEGATLLHNVVTGQMVALDQRETEVVNRLPQGYDPAIRQLVTKHYLVPEDYDEYQQVVKLKKVLREFDEVHEQKGIINHYTILPTTACNARCYYCFEQGVERVTMTRETADDVARFVAEHSGGKNVLLSWFGGEPTLAVNRIDQICSGLRASGVEFSSEITTNGYLLDEQTTKKARELWKLNFAMICVDGTEEGYNRTKRFIYEDSNPYKVVMSNIESLLKQGIKVHLRMNFDVGNYGAFSDLVDEAVERFRSYDNLIVSAHPVSGIYADETGVVKHGSDAWFEDKLIELNDIADEAGLQHRDMALPQLRHKLCMAASNAAVVITAEGKLASCPEQFSEQQWKGSLAEGVTNAELVRAWKEVAVFDKCRNCASFPDCVVTAHCRAAGNCCARKAISQGQRQTMRKRYSDFQRARSILRGER